jgi:hypothetical protein
MLTLPVCLQLLEMKRLQLHEVALVPSSANLLHPFSVRPNDLLRVAGRELRIGLEAV